MPAQPISLRTLVLTLAVAGCGDGGSGPANPTQAHERGFARLADSLERAGEPDAAQTMKGMAELVRLTGRVGSLEVAVDGVAWPMTAVAVEVAAPEESCTSYDCVWADRPLRVLVAWRDAELNEAMTLLADSSGTVGFPPPFDPADTLEIDDDFDPDAPIPASALGVLGDRRSEKAWVATAGTFSNALQATRGSCPSSALIPTSVQYQCARADFRFGVAGTFTGGAVNATVADESRQVVVASQAVPGVVLTVTGQPGQLARRGLLHAVRAARPGGGQALLPGVR